MKFLLRESIEKISRMSEEGQNNLAKEISNEGKFNILDIFINKAEAAVPIAIGACLSNPGCAALLLSGAVIISSKLQDAIKSKPSYQEGLNFFEKNDIKNKQYIKQSTVSAAASGAPDPGDDFDPDDEKNKDYNKQERWKEHYNNKTPKEIKKSIRSLDKQIKIHEDKISNPDKYVKDFLKRNDQYKIGIVKKWGKEIKNFEELKKVLKNILIDK